MIVCNKFSKISHFITIIEKIIAEGLARLFKNNIWKLYKLPESVISDRGLQFVVELIKKLNEMLEIETKLSIAFHLQMNK